MDVPLTVFFQIQIESGQGDGDDTAVNVIRLLCKQAWGDFLEAGSVTSATQSWGDWQSPIYCPADYWIVAYRVRHVLYFLLDLKRRSETHWR